MITNYDHGRYSYYSAYQSKVNIGLTPCGNFWLVTAILMLFKNYYSSTRHKSVVPYQTSD